MEFVPIPGTSGLGSLVRLPQELRDKIYEIVFKSGHTALLRASRCMHENAKDSLYRDLILQANIVHYEFKTKLFDHCRYSYEPSPPNIDFGRIRNLCIAITISNQISNEDTFTRGAPGTDGVGIARTFQHHSYLFHIFRDVVLPIKKRVRCDPRLELPRHRETQTVELAALWWLRGLERLHVKVSQYRSLSFLLSYFVSY